MGMNAQNVMFFSSKQGLSNSRIRNIMEDSRHNIWLTTQSGLNRYDGVKMNVYRHEIGNPNSLRHDESTCVFEYAHNQMLVGTGSGVQLYDYATDQFTDIPFILENGDTLMPRTVHISRIQKDRVVICFAGYGHGELKKDKEGRLYIQRIAEFNTDEPAQGPVMFMEDRKQNLWVVNSQNSVFRKTAKGFRKYAELVDVRKVSMSTTGKVYAATYSQGFWVYQPQGDRFEQVAPASEMKGKVIGLNPWMDGRMLICTDGGGLRVYDEQTGRVTLSSISVKDFDFTTSNVSDAIQDSFGNVWVGIYMKGVMMKPVNQSAFEYIGHNSITKNSIGSNSVFAVSKAVAPAGYRDGLWVAVDNDGLYLVSADGRQSTHWTKETNPEMPQAFTTMWSVDSSTLLLGTFAEGLWQMKPGGRFSLLTKDINRIFEIRPAAQEGYYWITTIGDGFYYYEQATGKYQNVRPDYGKPDGTSILGNPYVYSLMPLKEKLFVGTADGLTVCYPERDGSFKKASTKLLSGKSVRFFAVSPDQSLVWVATNAGLLKMDYKTLEYRTYTTEDGLPINSITSLCVDGKQLWVGTDFGLSCMDTEQETFTNFFADDGLQENEFSRGAVLALNGKIYLGGIGGITYFDTKEMARWQSEGKGLHLRFVDIMLGGKTVHKGDMSGSYEMLQGLIDECGRIDVCHTDKQFTLELCVEGLNNQHVTYEYSINGGKWMDQGSNNNRIIFDNLESGTYHIKVRAHVSGAVSDERELVAVVHPAWYASLWAKLVYFFLFVALCWLVYEYVKRQMRLRRVMARTRQQRELNEARVQFFMNISHEIRTPMTLILAPLEKLISKDKDAERQRNYQLMKQNSKRILRLINQMMDVRKIEQGKFLLDYHQVELVDFLQNIFDVFVTNAQSRNITYEFVHEMDRMPVYVDPENTDKIVMNLLSNAFKFTPDGGKIVMQLTNKGGENFELSVADSGVGIKEEDKKKIFERFYSAQHQNGYIGTGIGLNLTSMLVKLHKGTITVADNPEGKGTLFVVTMPVGEESLQVMKPEPTEPLVEGLDTIEQDTADLLTVGKPLDTHRRNAVLVEDDEAIRQYVHSELSNDLVVQVCGNGQEAWDYIVSHPDKVDVVISDIMMPVMDGMTLCQKLKSNFNTNHIPIVLMTALGSDADRIAGLTNGADAYVSKPFNIDVLRSTVLQLMKTRQLLQGKYHGDKQQEEKIDRVEIESPDEHLMRRVMKTINENMDNSELSVEMIADKVGISRVHFYRKMKDLTGQAPRDFLKYVRLKEAARMLSEKKLDITGVSIATGFKSLSAFSTNFKALYGLSPTEWVKQHERED